MKPLPGNMFKVVVIFLGFVIPYLIIYKVFFTWWPLSWGDAPYFYPENLNELLFEPLLWNFRNDNFGQPQSSLLWLFLPTFSYGVLAYLFNLSSEVLIRLVFYFPATILSLVGAWVFMGQVTANRWGRFLGSFLYAFNTYFLMLLDGGQIGVALAYGLFPLSTFAFLQFWNKPNLRNYLFALVTFFLISNTDLRIFLILILFVGLWQLIRFFSFGESLLERKKIIFLGGLFLSAVALDTFWIIPFLTNYSAFGTGAVLEGGANLPTFIDSLLLFQPHFPSNEFGKLSTAPFYFWLLPVVTLNGLFFLKGVKKRFYLYLAFLGLFLAFLAKGGNAPGGEIYNFMINHFPFGVAFRDSSKFYIPLILIASVLLGVSWEKINEKITRPGWQVLILLGLYIYLILLIYPALGGSLSGALGKGGAVGSFQTIYHNLSQDTSFYRTLWFDERPPLAFSSWEKPALSANLLYQERPFASMIDGRYDLFQYLRSPQLKEWLRLLGVKYVFFPDNERKKTWTEEDKSERKNFLQLVSALPLWQQLSWPLSFKAYQVDDPLPRIFAQEKIYLVLGGEEIYRQLIKRSDFSLFGQGFVFLEQGGINPALLKDIPPQAATFVFVNKKEEDLTMSLNQDLMVAPSKAKINQWMPRDSSDYLTWKYDLLKQNIRSYEFDFGQGVAFSTIAGEKIQFDLPVQSDGKYYLGVRFTTGSGSQGLKIKIANREKVFLNHNPPSFVWQILGPIEIVKGQSKLELTNNGGFSMINTVALIPEERFFRNQNLTRELINRFPTLKIENDQDWQQLDEKVTTTFLPVDYQQLNPTLYQINSLPAKGKWLIFTDHYHPGWQLQGGERNIHLPFYAIFNGFYLDGLTKDLRLVFVPQKNTSWGIMISVASFAVIILTVTIVMAKNRQGGKKKSG